MPTIGFANLTETQDFPRRVRQGLEQAAAAHGFDLIVRDNNFDNARVMENARFFVEERVDICMIYHLDERYNPNVGPILIRKGIPILTIDIPMPIAYHYGVDNAQAGTITGQAATDWVHQHWGGQVDKVLGVTDSRLLGDIQGRMTRAVEVLVANTTLEDDDVMYISGDSSADIGRERALTVLERWQEHEHILILGLNDESAVAGLEAAHLLGKDAHVAAFGQGANLLEKIYRERPYLPFIGSMNFHAERYGQDLLEMTLQILAREKIERTRTFEPEYVSREQWMTGS